MKNLKYIILFSIIILFTIFSFTNAVTILFPSQGGTGTGIIPKAGQLPVGTSGGVYTPAWLTAGTNVTIATSSGSITISATGGNGAGATTTINSVSGPAFTFITSSDTNIGLTISTSTGQLTFTSNWIGTLANARIASSTQFIAGYTHSLLTSGNPHSVTKSDVGLGSVENVALSTWGGSANILTVGTIATGIWQGTAIDISGFTNLAAGRSLTMSGDSVEGDAELFTDTKCVYIEDPVATDDLVSLWRSSIAITFTKIWAESDQTITFNLQEDDDSPANILSASLAPAAGTVFSTSFADASFAAGSRLDLVVDSVANTPTWVSICFDYTKDD